MIVKVLDDRKRELTFGAAPRRVVSLVPSDTHSVAALGCARALVGRTDYCEEPREISGRVPSVGGTKNPSLDKILDLSPDLVIANQEENTRGDLEALAQSGVKVLVSFPRRAADGLAHFARLARILRVEGDAPVKALLREGYAAIREAEAARARARAPRVFCPIWMKPLMTVNGETFVSDVLALAGAENVFADRDVCRSGGAAQHASRRYPRVTIEEVAARAPEIVLLPDEPHPFSEEDAAVFRALAVPAAERGAVVRTSGRDLCWYGAWTAAALPRVRALIASLTGDR